MIALKCRKHMHDTGPEGRGERKSVPHGKSETQKEKKRGDRHGRDCDDLTLSRGDVRQDAAILVDRLGYPIGGQSLEATGNRRTGNQGKKEGAAIFQETNNPLFRPTDKRKAFGEKSWFAWSA